MQLDLILLILKQHIVYSNTYSLTMSKIQIYHQIVEHNNIKNSKFSNENLPAIKNTNICNQYPVLNSQPTTSVRSDKRLQHKKVTLKDQTKKKFVNH